MTCTPYLFGVISKALLIVIGGRRSTWRRKEEEKILASVAENPSRSAGLLQGTFSACLSVAALHVGLHSVG